MIDMLPLIKNTSAYKTVKADIKSNRLSHAYLILFKDKVYSEAVLRIFAKTVFCENDDPCGNCRACRLIDEGRFPDAKEFPENGNSIVKDDVLSLIEQSFLKPIEGDKKLFLLKNAESMNATAQNKILKTLEEPPSGVHIFMCATGEFNLLPTVRSRVKTLTIPEFSKDTLFDVMRPYYTDEEKLKAAIFCGDGTVGRSEALYGDEKTLATLSFTTDLMLNMKSSRNLPEFSKKLSDLKIDFGEFLTVFELTLRDLLCYNHGEKALVFNSEQSSRVLSAGGYNDGAIIYILDRISETRRMLAANVNAQMVSDKFLFSVLEGKHKWSK